MDKEGEYRIKCAQWERIDSLQKILKKASDELQALIVALELDADRPPMKEDFK